MGAEPFPKPDISPGRVRSFSHHRLQIVAASPTTDRMASSDIDPPWYLQRTDDQMISPPAQAFMAERMGATVRTVAASHAPFMARPVDVAEIIALAR